MATLNLNKKKFIDEENLKTIVKIGISFGERLNSIESKCIALYDETHSYLKDELCIYDNYIYKCNSTATGTWNPDRWTLIGDDITELTLDEIKAMLGLTQEQLNTLASIILDNEIRLDKTWSSSKTYSDIQDAIKECKQYCVTELAKKSTGSFKKANSTSEVTDGNYLYLILNSSTNKYDIYALVDSNVELLTSVDVNLDDYYTKTEINNDFLKKTDATSTYATKIELNDKADATALDDKVDKTDIVDNLTSIDTNKPLSANQGKILDDKKLNKTDITTTIDSSSTDSQVPSAKVVYDNVKNKNTIQSTGTIANYSSVFDWAINNIGATCGYEGNMFDDCPLNHTWGILVCIGTKVESGLKVLFCTNYNKDIYTRTIQRRQGVNGWVETSWQRLCNTSVEDVSLKTLKNSSDINSDAVISYIVKNGMCSVSVNTVSSTKMSTGNITLTTGLPIPANTSCWYSICTNSNATNAPLQNLLLRIDSSGNLIAYKGTDNINYFGSFSYPVEES